VLATDTGGLLQSPTNAQNGYQAPPTATPQGLCTTWTAQLHQMWTDANHTGHTSAVRCFTTPSRVKPCGGTGLPACQ
jgi:hypothetical protein